MEAPQQAREHFTALLSKVQELTLENQLLKSTLAKSDLPKKKIKKAKKTAKTKPTKSTKELAKT